ncbi:MAG: LamG-like jellyroll fold domain-containing protein, partial [Planctomycetia bacterium]|nr:LamG-like jellyroll fold domain-containing protein [Planctomycetia bacterium]
MVAWEKSVSPLFDSRVPRHTEEENDTQPQPQSWFKRLLLGSGELNSQKDTATKHHSPFVLTIVVAVFFILIGSAEIFHWRQSSRSPDVKFDTVGTIAETIDVQWAPESEAFKRGEAIGANTFVLKRGSVKLVLANGVELVLEGPGEYIINSPMSTFCRSGRLSANVSPEGIGFEVSTRFASIVDRGTEFFLEVSDDHALVETISGKVDVALLKKTPVSLPVGKGIKVDQMQNTQTVPKLSGHYIDSVRFQENLLSFLKSKHAELEVTRQRELRQPDLLACFDFSQQTNLPIANASLRGKTLSKEATLRGGKTGEGSSYGTKSLVLSQTGDAALFDMPGSYNDLTIIAHVRIDQFMKTGNVLLASGLHHNKPGAFLWQMLNDGRMQVQVTPDKNKMQESCYYSTPFYFRRYCGTWSTLAVVIHGSNKQISFYNDGKLLTSVPWNEPIPLTLGPSAVGNVVDPPRNAENRSLSGAVGEVFIFDRSLSTEEIQT